MTQKVPALQTVENLTAAALTTQINAAAAAAQAAASVKLSGDVVQVVNTIVGTVATGTTVLPFDNTIPQNTEGDQFMSLAITPTNAANTLLIEVVTVLAGSVGSNFTSALFQDTTAGALAAAITSQASAGLPMTTSFKHKMLAGTTSPTTFKVRCGNGSAGTVTFNGASGAQLMGGVMASSITITEIKA